MARANCYLYGNPSAKSVIEIALHDALARSKGVPVHELLGAKRRERVAILPERLEAQLRSLLVNELNVDPARLMPILHYDGTPITARFIIREIAERMRLLNVQPLKKGKAA